MREADRRNVARLPVEQRNRLLEMRDRKEGRLAGSHFMLAGTPDVPLPRIPQKWEIERAAALDTNGLSRVTIEVLDVGLGGFSGGSSGWSSRPPPLSQECHPVFTPSTGVIVLDEGQVVDSLMLVDAQIEMVGFSPIASSSAERPTPQFLGQKKMKIWDEGILNRIVTETNKYAANLPSDCAQHSRIRRWTPINNEELWTFFGVVIDHPKDLALYESLLLWKGRLSFSQVIVTKAAQVGIKSYELCESKSGYAPVKMSSMMSTAPILCLRVRPQGLL
uniref:PiggyBac transposable element-derived protein domain-containing protein n=1 Tax=Heliothis virescens TaxID=7102 RepID=A0A2A4IUU3_HELVI